MHEFLIKLCCCFLQVNGVKHIEDTDDLAKKDDEQLDISTKQVLRKLVEDGLDNRQVKKQNILCESS